VDIGVANYGALGHVPTPRLQTVTFSVTSEPHKLTLDFVWFPCPESLYWHFCFVTVYCMNINISVSPLNYFLLVSCPSHTKSWWRHCPWSWDKSRDVETWTKRTNDSSAESVLDHLKFLKARRRCACAILYGNEMMIVESGLNKSGCETGADVARHRGSDMTENTKVVIKRICTGYWQIAADWRPMWWLAQRDSLSM